MKIPKPTKSEEMSHPIYKSVEDMLGALKPGCPMHKALNEVYEKLLEMADHWRDDDLKAQ